MKRALWVLAAVFALYACGGNPVGQGGSGGGRAEQESPPEAEPSTATPTEGRAYPAGAVVPFPDFDLRVLDVIERDSFEYADFVNPDGSISNPEVLPTAGAFLIVAYSARNTADKPLEFGTGATLTASGQTYETSDEAEHPDSGDYGFELAPEQMKVGLFVFDVGADARPETISIGEGYQGNYDRPPVEIDLTNEEPGSAAPDEILALQYEYANMAAWGEAYALYASQSKERVSEARFTEYQTGGPRTAIAEYSFPSVEVDRSQAAVNRVLTVSSAEGEGQDEATQPMALEDAGWRVVMREEQIELFTRP